MSLTDDELVVACRNIGFDLTCGACAGQFYTGSAMGDHTCKPSRVVPIELAELKDTIIAKLIGEKTALAARLEAARLVVNELRAKWYSEEGRASLALIASELDRNAG
jgi:hypothetical protein